MYKPHLRYSQEKFTNPRRLSSTNLADRKNYTHFWTYLIIKNQSKLGATLTVRADLTPINGVYNRSLALSSRQNAAKCLRTYDKQWKTHKTIGRWRPLNLAAFIGGLQQSLDSLTYKPPTDVNSLFSHQSFIDKHAPLTVARVRRRRSAPWFDADCRAAEIKLRQLVKRHRRLRPAQSEDRVASAVQLHMGVVPAKVEVILDKCVFTLIRGA